MKHILSILIFGTLFLIPVTSFAVPGDASLFMTNWVKFNSNDSPQELPSIKVTDTTGNNIVLEKGFTIILPKDMDVIWDKTVLEVSVDQKLTAVNYNKTLKNMNIPVSKTFAAGESVTITGAKVRIYETAGSYQNLGLDVTGDGIADSQGVNGLQLDDTVRKTDLLAPFPITGLTYQQGTSTVSMRWENPADPDYNGIFLKRTLTRNGATNAADFTIDKAATLYTDSDIIAGDVIEYSFKTKDNVTNQSEAVTTKVTIPAIEEAPPPPPPVEVAVPPAQPEAPPEEPAQPLAVPKPTVFDSVTDADIEAAVAKYRDISAETENIKAVVFLIKNKAFKGKRGKIYLARRIKYKEFAAVLGVAFKIKPKKGSYLLHLKKLGFIPKKTSSLKSVSRKKALRILLKAKGVSLKSQNIVDSAATLKGSITRGEVVSWLVKVLE